jgi:hypothetical protein
MTGYGVHQRNHDEDVHVEFNGIEMPRHRRLIVLVRSKLR